MKPISSIPKIGHATCLQTTAAGALFVVAISLPSIVQAQSSTSAQTVKSTKPALTATIPKQRPTKGKPGWIEGVLRKEMTAGGFSWGSAAHMRIYKEENVLEMWLKKEGRYEKFKNFDICKWSGKLGPKLLEGDKQSPEGVYSVERRHMASRTKNHRAVNLNFPNPLDRRLNRTGSALQIHGGCGSIGCYAMTDRGIEEIYRILDASFKSGQTRISTHIFPFHMTDEKLEARKKHPSFGYWSMLKPIYESFNKTKTLPGVRVCGTRYVAPGDQARPPEQCVPVWQSGKVTLASLSAPSTAALKPRTSKTTTKSSVKRKAAVKPKRVVKRKPRPSIVVKCNLRLPSCKRWLANQRRKLASRGISGAGVRQAGASYVRKGGSTSRSGSSSRASTVSGNKTVVRSARSIARARRRRALRR